MLSGTTSSKSGRYTVFHVRSDDTNTEHGSREPKGWAKKLCIQPEMGRTSRDSGSWRFLDGILLESRYIAVQGTFYISRPWRFVAPFQTLTSLWYVWSRLFGIRVLFRLHSPIIKRGVKRECSRMPCSFAACKIWSLEMPREHWRHERRTVDFMYYHAQKQSL